jgi:hypothetical protein
MDKLAKVLETLVLALVSRGFGYALVLGITASAISTAFTLFALDSYLGLDKHPPIVHGPWFVGEFFLIVAVVAGIAAFMSSREDRMKAQEAAIATREASVAEREAAVARREGGDILTGFREKLSGNWELTFRGWNYNHLGEPEEVDGLGYAVFKISERTQKLVMRTSIRSDPDFDDENVAVEAISIWPPQNPKHLDYFVDLTLASELGEIVRGAVFVHLDIDLDSDDRPVRLTGTWYDLDGQFARARKTAWSARNPGRTITNGLPLRGRISFQRFGEDDVVTSSCGRSGNMRVETRPIVHATETRNDGDLLKAMAKTVN